MASSLRFYFLPSRFNHTGKSLGLQPSRDRRTSVNSRPGDTPRFLRSWFPRPTTHFTTACEARDHPIKLASGRFHNQAENHVRRAATENRCACISRVQQGGSSMIRKANVRRCCDCIQRSVNVERIFANRGELKNDHLTPGDVLVYGMGYAGQRYSPLTQINKENVARLVPVWAYSITDNRGAEAFPVVKDGVIYTTAHNATVAVDALTGRQMWRANHEYPPETLRVVCCGIVNRGAAIYNGKIIRALLDNQIIALDAKTGKEVWRTKSPEPTRPRTAMR